MTDFIILGSDTDAGKTTFAALWLAAFGEPWAYWKPLESGESDSERVRRLVPSATVLPPFRSFAEPVAPMLAAQSIGELIPPAPEIVAARPSPHDRRLVIETFGSPFSPLNDAELQVELIRRLARPAVLVSSSAIGAIGRTLQCLRALAAVGVKPVGVVLVGKRDDFAAEQIARRADGIPVVSFTPPATWDANGVALSARHQTAPLEIVRGWVESRLAPSPRALLGERDLRGSEQ